MAARALIGGLTEVAIRAAGHPSERDHARAAAAVLAHAAVRGVIYTPKSHFGVSSPE